MRVYQEIIDLECVLHSLQPLGAYNLIIGRMGSPAYYCRTSDRFELPRVAYENVETT
ncbi:MAG: hypothetical protein LH649_04150 [Pseudanabaena sp. CAN_BIN31]|nr:hypothetical protein [Pseudanabaena sp. CAN_BIN31]